MEGDPLDEPDELDLVYADLEKARAEIETLKRHWVEDDRDLNQLIELCKRAADALEQTAYWACDSDPTQQLITELRQASK
jgi:hypothetical protein